VAFKEGGVAFEEKEWHLKDICRGIVAFEEE
jgi:hypothetical protein